MGGEMPAMMAVDDRNYATLGRVLNVVQPPVVQPVNCEGKGGGCK